MVDRAVIPVYDNNNKMVGCTGRSIFNQCLSCKLYHKPGNLCPSKSFEYKYSKWKNNEGFKKEHYLYNLWEALPFIKQKNQIILVESPGNVLRLEEAGIHNSVALFGCSMTEPQLALINELGITNIIIILDNDEAGMNAKKFLQDKCSRLFNLRFIEIVDFNDIGDMTIDQVKKEIGTKL